VEEIMIIWSIVLFCLGVLALLDAQFNYGYLFRTTNSIMFLLVALGILIRTRSLKKMGFREQLIVHNDDLKSRIMQLRESNTTEKKPEPIK
jgi:hypothetical protein